MNTLSNLISLEFIISIFYILFVILINYKNKKDYILLFNKMISERFTDKNVIDSFGNYIKTHPLSIFNSDLRCKMIPSLIVFDDRKHLKFIVKRIRIIDVHNEYIDILIYSLFLLNEYGYLNEYLELEKKVIKTKNKSISNRYELIFGDELDLNKISIDDFSPYLQGMISYKLGVESVLKNEFETSKKYFSDAVNKIYELSMINLLKKKELYSEEK